MEILVKQIISLLEKLAPKTEVAIFWEKIERIRQEVKMSATSSFRTSKRNGAVGGKINSKHLQNLAVDVILDSVTDAERLKFLCKREGLFLLDEKDHYHIQVPKNA